MKKFLLALSIGFTSVAALSNCVYAQNSVFPVAFNDAKKFRSSIRYTAAVVSPAYSITNAPLGKNFNAKAILDFQDRYKAASDVKWFADGNGFVSYFIQDGHGSRVYYDKKGRWQSSLILYGEDKLPRDIRTTIKSVYFDWTITIVEEVQTINGMAYIVNLEDKSNIKVLKVSDQGEMATMLALIKAQ